jgi:transposase
MSPLDLLGPFPNLSVRDLAVTDGLVCVAADSTAPVAACPACGTSSDRVHSRYTRTVADLSWQGRRVVLRLTARRFRCRTPGCPRQVFCERLPHTVAAHARTTGRLADVHRVVGLAVGGEAGARLADRLAVPTSPDTILRRVRATASEPAPLPRVVGIDDWAWKRGHRYGTIVVDLERGRVIDLLPDRDAATVKRWLAEHPGVEVVSRDRWSAYAQAAAEAAPQATQVADRWHLLKNLREAVERLFERHAGPIAAALAAVAPLQAPPTPPAVEVSGLDTEPSPPVPAEDPKARRRCGRFDRVRELHRQGWSVRQIARDLGLARNTVRRYLRSGRCPDWTPGRPRPTRLSAHRGWLDRRISEGCTNAAELHRELVGRGIRASVSTVRRFVARRLGAAGMRRVRVNAAGPAAPPVPTPRQLSFEWVRRPSDRRTDEQAHLTAVRGVGGEVAEGLDLADGFAAMVRGRSAGSFDGWLTAAEGADCPEVRRFAEGVRRDEAAVRAAVGSPWSNGQVEGQVGRLKLIKRAGYGRAGFELLRARVLNRV